MFGFFRRLCDRFVARFGVERCRFVRMNSSDVIVVLLKERMSIEGEMRIHQRLEHVFPGRKVAVLHNGAELVVLQTATKAEQ